jgi:hypothetical protein
MSEPLKPQRRRKRGFPIQVDRLLASMTRRGWNAAQLQRHSGVSAGAISKALRPKSPRSAASATGKTDETDSSGFDRRVICQIARALDCEPQWLAPTLTHGSTSPPSSAEHEIAEKLVGDLIRGELTLPKATPFSKKAFLRSAHLRCEQRGRLEGQSILNWDGVFDLICQRGLLYRCAPNRYDASGPGLEEMTLLIGDRLALEVQQAKTAVRRSIDLQFRAAVEKELRAAIHHCEEATRHCSFEQFAAGDRQFHLAWTINEPYRRQAMARMLRHFRRSNERMKLTSATPETVHDDRQGAIMNRFLRTLCAVFDEFVREAPLRDRENAVADAIAMHVEISFEIVKSNYQKLRRTTGTSRRNAALE